MVKSIYDCLTFHCACDFFFFVEPVCPFLCKQATFHRVFGRAYNMFVTVLCHLKEGIILHAAVQMQ